MSLAFDIFEEVQTSRRRIAAAQAAAQATRATYSSPRSEVEALTQSFIERGVGPRTARYWAECEAEQPA